MVRNSTGNQRWRTLQGALAALLFGLLNAAVAADEPRPVIDVHLHSSWWGQPGLLTPLTGDTAPDSESAHRSKTLDELRRMGIVVGLVDGRNATAWVEESVGRLLRAQSPCGPKADPAILRELLEQGEIAAVSEFAPQYGGLAPDDPSIAHCFELAETYDVPVGIHMGLGPPSAAYRGRPNYRMALSNPLLLEEVLIKHPKLRLWVMHAGWPMLDEMLGLLYAHPQVYLDISVINWVLPREEFHHYLRRLVGAGFHERILFGSDQMQWPQAIGKGIDAIESANFLSEAQKHDILCNNAARFLRLDPAVCGDAPSGP